MQIFSYVFKQNQQPAHKYVTYLTVDLKFLKSQPLKMQTVELSTSPRANYENFANLFFIFTCPSNKNANAMTVLPPKTNILRVFLNCYNSSHIKIFIPVINVPRFCHTTNMQSKFQLSSCFVYKTFVYATAKQKIRGNGRTSEQQNQRATKFSEDETTIFAVKTLNITKRNQISKLKSSLVICHIKVKLYEYSIFFAMQLAICNSH